MELRKTPFAVREFPLAFTDVKKNRWERQQEDSSEEDFEPQAVRRESADHCVAQGLVVAMPGLLDGGDFFPALAKTGRPTIRSDLPRMRRGGACGEAPGRKSLTAASFSRADSAGH